MFFHENAHENVAEMAAIVSRGGCGCGDELPYANLAP